MDSDGDCIIEESDDNLDNLLKKQLLRVRNEISEREKREDPQLTASGIETTGIANFFFFFKILKFESATIHGIAEKEVRN